MSVKVSVVVPVYNPGPYIEDCVGSLLRQSLPPGEFEVVFVDDGSTDGTPARLDALAAEHSHIQVIHQEPSGWSGKPRNVGVAASRGEYVMFVDNDDYLGDEALERMYAYAVENDADVVIGKMAGKGRPVPVELFRRNHPRATVENAPLMDSLTPHKMFRRAFLDRIGLRFPEGRRRLEDHVFVAEAYLRAETISVLSDYVCYYHVKRDDASNAGFQRFDPVGYFKNLREALDVVERHTEPGALRDRMYRRWLRNEMVERMRGTRLLNLPDDYRRELFGEIRDVVAERFGPSVAAPLAPTQRVVAALVAADRYEDTLAFAEWEASLAPRAAAGAVGWEKGVLRFDLTAGYTTRGEPMVFPADGAHTEPEGAPEDVAAAIAWVLADATARFGSADVDVVVRERATAAQYYLPAEVTREQEPAGDGEEAGVRLRLRASVSLDPAVAAGGSPLRPGLWDLFVRVKLGGWARECRIDPAPGAPRPAGNAAVTADGVVLPYWTARDTLSLDVDKASKNLRLDRLSPSAVTVTGDRLRATLPLHVADRSDVLLRLAGPADDPRLQAPGTLSPGEDAARSSVLEAALPLDAAPREVPLRLLLAADPRAAEPRFLPLPVSLSVVTDGVRVRHAALPRTAGRRPGAVRGLHRLARRLPLPVRRAVVRAMDTLVPGLRARLTDGKRD
ncbi:glycosyltransferase family 2 protein [Streptomyces fragilis]|uniref:Glycosyltransferase family A protein n=1 Tax=Streptomyces fragilis TaxID=67301 RepID=A0ABV2YPU6_9ACTN|nr:glycosyltransferase family A protein [Streptomyces fragilis]